MCPTGIIVLFACKSCSASFQSVPSFIEHKRINHFEEFQNMAVILFEETRIKPYNHTPAPEERLFPTLESKSTPNSDESAVLTTRNDVTLDNGNKSEDFKSSVYPCIDIKSESDSFSNGSETEINPQIISVTSTSQKYIENSSRFSYKEKTSQPAAAHLKQIGPNNSRNTDNTRNRSIPRQCSKIQQKIITYNKNKGDSDNISLRVQPEIPALENPYISLRRLTSKQIQNYSSRVETEPKTQQAQGQELSDDLNHHQDVDQDVEPDLAIFLRPKVEIFEACDDDVAYADFTCKFCKINFLSYTALQIHLQTCVSFVQTSHNSYCSLCNSHCPSSPDLQAHNLTQHDNEHDRDMEEKLGLLFKKRKRAGVRIQVQPYKCNVCGSWFVTEATLANHLMTHSEDRPFQCTYPGCGKSFKTIHFLSSHRSVHYKGFSCKFPNCESTFGSKESLKDHVQTHMNKLLYVTSSSFSGK